MAKTDLIANRSMTYMTRRLLPDDVFEAKPRDAKVLVACRKARYPDGLANAKQVPEPKKAPPKARAPRTKKAG